jgi:Peptidase M15
MQNRRNVDLRHSVVSALVTLAAAAIPSLLPAAARAETAPDGTREDAPPRDKKAKKPPTHGASRSKKTAHKAAPEGTRRCLGAPITVDRTGLEGQTLVLLDCHDKPIEAAQRALSVLARPWGAQRPVHEGGAGPRPVGAQGKPQARISKGEVAPGIRLLDRGLLARVDAIARHFAGRPLSLVSGYRPQSRGSQHQSGRALDLRVAGVSNEALVAFCRTLADTGCGYYPNSSFVHVDVRSPGTGGVTWIDASGPGETPHYVQQWPPPRGEPAAPALPTAPSGAGLRATTDPWGLDPVDEHGAAPEP